MRTATPPSALYHIKLKTREQHIRFTAPYQNSSEAMMRLMDWLQANYGDDALPVSVSIMRARAY